MADRLAGLEKRLDKTWTSAHVNLVIYGLPEGQANMVDVAQACRNTGMPEPAGQDVRRLGRPQADGDRRPRPVLLQLQSVSAKHGYFSFSKGFRQHGVSESSALRLLKTHGLRPYWRQGRRFYKQRDQVKRLLKGDPLPPAAAAVIEPIEQGRTTTLVRPMHSRPPLPPRRPAQPAAQPSPSAAPACAPPAPPLQRLLSRRRGAASLVRGFWSGTSEA